MIHPLKIILLILLHACCFLSCKKKVVEQAVRFPHMMVLKEVKTIGSAQLYTNKSALNNAAVLKSFIANEEDYFFNTQRATSEETIRFLSKDTIQFGSNQLYTYEQQDNQFILHSVMNLVAVNPQEFTYSLLKHHYQDPTTYLYKEIRIGKGDFNEFRLSAIGYKLRRWVTYNNEVSFHSENKARIFNEFNPAIISKLSATDTLAVQAYEYVFIR